MAPAAVQALNTRRAGILLHPTSLPGPRGCGDFGDDAFRFIDFLSAAGQTLWQMLPLGPTHANGSPYQCLSVHAGSPRLISLDRLAQWGWLDGAALTRADAAGTEGHEELVELARAGFLERAPAEDRAAFDEFMSAQQDWLPDYALFQALRTRYECADWSRWPGALRDRDGAALEKARRKHRAAIERVCFEQFVFHRQWGAVRAEANRRGILIMGDMPIFVAHDSVDVWVNRHLFELDDKGHPAVVAGVPPDYFSSTGQRWGNPHYRWKLMEQDGFAWWMQRIERQVRMFDLVRIDHFRGFEAYWEIPADHPTAMGGRWVEGPGATFFEAVLRRFGALPFVAEDLGLITPQVHALREQYRMPGMRILQFAFDGGSDNPYLPHSHAKDSVVYTGTHDNDTTLGWYRGLDAQAQARVLEYLGQPQEAMPWPLIRAALASVANTAVIPLQDALCLGGEHRMNTPGTTQDNWRWRFTWDQVAPDLAARLRHMNALYGRIPPAG
ncbi:MAG: 4-alpha-glucanotransferase [Gammaproteobacteria bacterium]|nr:4-alpha-glucanotransferase [Gammaproteobacteria bacterium]